MQLCHIALAEILQMQEGFVCMFMTAIVPQALRATFSSTQWQTHGRNSQDSGGDPVQISSIQLLRQYNTSVYRFFLPYVHRPFNLPLASRMKIVTSNSMLLPLDTQ